MAVWYPTTADAVPLPLKGEAGVLTSLIFKDRIEV